MRPAATCGAALPAAVVTSSICAPSNAVIASAEPLNATAEVAGIAAERFDQQSAATWLWLPSVVAKPVATEFGSFRRAARSLPVVIDEAAFTA
jgi:hypothetical protein